MSEFGKTDGQKITEMVVGGAVLLFMSLGGVSVFYMLAV
jgi:hypothetical protein